MDLQRGELCQSVMRRKNPLASDWELRRRADELGALCQRRNGLGWRDLRYKKLIDLDHATLEVVVDLSPGLVDPGFVAVVLLHRFLNQAVVFFAKFGIVAFLAQKLTYVGKVSLEFVLHGDEVFDVVETVKLALGGGVNLPLAGVQLFGKRSNVAFEVLKW